MLSNHSAALYFSFGHVHLLFWLFNDTFSPGDRISCDGGESSYFHRGRKAPFLDLAADFADLSLWLECQFWPDKRWKPHNRLVRYHFFKFLILTKFTILAIIESLEKGIRKCGQDIRILWAIICCHGCLSSFLWQKMFATPPPHPQWQRQQQDQIQNSGNNIPSKSCRLWTSDHY